MGAGRFHQRRRVGKEVLELDLAEVERLRRARHDDGVDFVIRFGERGFQRWLDRAADQRGLGARMLEHVGEIVGGEQRVDRDRNDARQHRAQEGDRPVGAILHEDERALLALDAPLLERGGEPSGAIVEFAVSHGAGVVDERRLIRAPRIGLKQMRREVERLRRRFNRACGHRRLPAPSEAPRGRLLPELAACGRSAAAQTTLARVGLMQYYASFIS